MADTERSPRGEEAGAWTAELEAALVRALQAAWRDLNEALFRGALRAPTISLSETAGRLGLWRAGERALELSRALVLEGAWGPVLEVLKHEMAHQYVSEVLGDPDPSPHGAAFASLCARLGIDARAVGAAPSGPELVAGEHRLLERIAKLLALAESPNAHEAEAAMAEAQRLMLKHNVEAAVGGGYAFRHLGRPTGRTSEHERLLACVLGEHFFVEVIWVPVWRAREGKRGSVLEVCGTPVNLEMAAYVHAFLLHTGERLWEDYQHQSGLRGRRERRTFLSGVMAGFRDKLERERTRHQQTGLVWVGDPELQRYLRRRHPYVRSTRHAGPQRTQAHAAGRAAGQKVVLHRPVAGREGGGRVRLLPPRR